jgi:hypothetical protein
MKNRNRNNQSLFWYGLLASIKVFFGIFILVVGLMLGTIILLGGNTILGLFVLFLLVGFGIYLALKGKAQRFDYQMQSGTIIHQGDWN